MEEKEAREKREELRGKWEGLRVFYEKVGKRKDDGSNSRVGAPRDGANTYAA